MTGRDPYSDAYDVLTSGIKRINNYRRNARAILDTIGPHIEAVLPEVEVIRWTDVLFITVAGFRIYFRGVYSPGYASIEIGRWNTSRRGFPSFVRHSLSDWDISPRKDPPDGDWLEWFRKDSLTKIVEALEWSRRDDGTFSGGGLTGGPRHPLCEEAHYLRSKSKNQGE